MTPIFESFLENGIEIPFQNAIYTSNPFVFMEGTSTIPQAESQELE